ncbi:MAG: undecaprenyl-diphosphate phosphatase [bacterium]
MSLLQVIILGIVEGITEFLPISSTGHLILLADILKVVKTDFLKTFEISIQFGAILAVVVLYWRKLFLDSEVIKKIITAFIPTAILGLVFYKIIKTYLMDSNIVVLCALFLGGVFLVVFELIYQRKIMEDAQIIDIKKISYKQSFLIGLFQSVAMVPGVSRSAATIVGGLILGLNRKTIVEFSFLLAVPTMAAATGLDLIKNASGFTAGQLTNLSVGFIISFIVAMASIKFLLAFIKKYSFISFGVYRIAISIIVWMIIF